MRVAPDPGFRFEEHDVVGAVEEPGSRHAPDAAADDPDTPLACAAPRAGFLGERRRRRERRGEDGRAEGLEDLTSRRAWAGRGAQPRDDSEWMNQNKNNRTFAGPEFMSCSPDRLIDPLRSEPRFEALVNKLRLHG